MNTRPSHNSLTESHHRAQMRTLRVIAAALTFIVFVHPVIADIPGATLAEITNLSAEVYPNSLAVGADGKVWFSDEHLTPHSVGFFTPDGKVTKFPVPCDQCNGNGDRLAYVESITVGPDGNAWFPYSYVNGDGAPLNGGMNTYIGRFTPAGQFTSFPMPTVDAFRRFTFGARGQAWITSGPDGNIWFTEDVPGKIGKITPAGVITEYPLAGGGAALPSIIAKGPDGNLWFTEFGVGKIGRITAAGVVSEFIAPRGTGTPGPFAITAGVDGNMWYTDTSGAICRVTPAGVVTRFDILEAGALPARPNVPNIITTGKDGKLYFTYSAWIGLPTGYQPRLAQLDPSFVSASGKAIVALGGVSTNTTAFGYGQQGRQVADCTSTSGKCVSLNYIDLTGAQGVLVVGGCTSSACADLPVAYCTTEKPDPTNTFNIVKVFELAVYAPPKCDPPITLNGQLSPINVLILMNVGEDFPTAADPESVEFEGAESPLDVNLSGKMPPGLVGADVFFGLIGLKGVAEEGGTYEFAVTITDKRKCTATVNYTVLVIAGPLKHRRGAKH
jgi:streptogramin lyase